MEQQPYETRRPVMQPYRSTGFATASLICAVMSIMSCMIFYVTFFFACLSILFAILSRQDTLHMPGASKLGLGISVLAITGTITLTGSSLVFLVETFGLDMILNHPEQILEDLLKMMEEMTQMGGAVHEPLL